MKFDMNFALQTILIALRGLPITLEIVFIVFALSFILGFLVAVGRENKSSLKAKFLTAYVSFIRGTPFMVQTYLLYIAIPTAVQQALFEKNIHFNVNVIKGYWYAYTILVLYFTALMSEMFRAGLSAVNKGQLDAAYSVGLTKRQSYRRIIFPQVVEHCLPVLCTYVTGIVKMSSLAFVFGVPEITALSKNNASRNLGYVEAYFVIAVFYILMNIGIEWIFKQIERRNKTKQTLTGGKKKNVKNSKFA